MFFDGSEKRFRSLATTEGEEARPSFPPGNPAGPFHPPQSRLSPDPPPLSHTLSVPPFETDDHTGPKKKPKKQTKLPDEEKASVRSGLLPALLRERDPRLSTALAMALASAASRDGVGSGPGSDDWPELLPALVSAVANGSSAAADENDDPTSRPGGEGAVALSGAIRGLSLLIDEIDDAAALEAAPRVLPAALRVVLSARAPTGLRTRALAVGRALLGALAHAAAGAGGGPGSLGGAPLSVAARAAADEALCSWLPAVAALLLSEDAAAAPAAAAAAAAEGKGFFDGGGTFSTELVAFRMEALRFASLALAAFSSRPAVKAQVAAVAAGAWRVVVAASAAHAAAEVDSGGDAAPSSGPPRYDSDGGEVSSSALLSRGLELMTQLSCDPRHAEALFGNPAPPSPCPSLADVLSAALAAMRLTTSAADEQGGDADACVTADDEGAGGPREAGEGLVSEAVASGGQASSRRANTTLPALAEAVRRALAASEGARRADAKGSWWKAREACWAALCASSEALVDGGRRGSPAGGDGGAAGGSLAPRALADELLRADLAPLASVGVSSAGSGTSPGAAPAASAVAAAGAAPAFLAGRALALAAALAPALDAARAARLLSAAAAALLASAAAGDDAGLSPLSVGACRAVIALSPVVAAAAAGGGAQLSELLPACFAGLSALVAGGEGAGASEGGALALALDAATALVRASGQASSPWARSLGAQALRAWAEHASDPLVSESAADVAKALSGSSAAGAEAVFEVALPALAGIVGRAAAAAAADAAAGAGALSGGREGGRDPTLVAGALSLLAELVAAAAPASPEAAAAAHAAATPAALALLNAASSIDSSVARACCDYVRALVLAGGPALVASEGALEALSSPLLRLLAGGLRGGGEGGAGGGDAAEAADADDAAGRVAPALCALARRAPPGEPALALARAAALAAARRLSLRGEGPAPMLAADCVALISRAFAFGFSGGGTAPPDASAASGTAAALAAEAAPGSSASSNAPTDLPPASSSAALASAPSGESQLPPSSTAQQQQQQPSTLLHVALRSWACHQQDLLGSSAINAAVAGLAALAALPSPSVVDAVLVRGTRVEEEEEAGIGVVIRTRARARAAAARPERWVAVTARAKAVQLLADALVEAAEGGGGKLGGGGEEDEWDTASDDDDDDDDDESDENESDEEARSRGGNSVAASLARAAAAAGGGAGSDLFAARAFLDDEDDFGPGGGDSAFDRDPLDPLACASPGEIAARGLKAAFALYPQWLQEVGGALLSAGQRRAVAAAFGVGEG